MRACHCFDRGDRGEAARFHSFALLWCLSTSSRSLIFSDFKTNFIHIMPASSTRLFPFSLAILLLFPTLASGLSSGEIQALDDLRTSIPGLRTLPAGPWIGSASSACQNNWHGLTCSSSIGSVTRMYVLSFICSRPRI